MAQETSLEVAIAIRAAPSVRHAVDTTPSGRHDLERTSVRRRTDLIATSHTADALLSHRRHRRRRQNRELNRRASIGDASKVWLQPDGFSEAMERFACTMIQRPDRRNQPFNLRGPICRVFLWSTTIQWFVWPLRSFLNGTTFR